MEICTQHKFDVLAYIKRHGASERVIEEARGLLPHDVGWHKDLGFKNIWGGPSVTVETDPELSVYFPSEE